ncbi:MAG: hypothetical protein KF850_10130 [Labilithrix sp.]|nr:hypothetical protein [Labilithrix sp.]MBX3212379.1 hypothetical protein [Labilithrix sp.]
MPRPREVAVTLTLAGVRLLVGSTRARRLAKTTRQIRPSSVSRQSPNTSIVSAPRRQSPSASLPVRLMRVPTGYGEWLADVKARIHAAQQRAALAANRELLTLYWQLGRDILDRQRRAGWGAGIVDRVSADLRAAFPAVRGFSRANLMYMRAFAEAWPEVGAIVQQPVGQLPWGHNLVLLTKLKTRAARLAYAASALENGWSRAVLVHHIEMRTVERQGKALWAITLAGMRTMGAFALTDSVGQLP